MSYVTEYVLPAALGELQRLSAAGHDVDRKIIKMLRLNTGTPQYVIDEEEAAAAAAAAPAEEAAAQ